MPINKFKKIPVSLIAVILLALAFRLYTLGERDFWFDEVNTIKLSQAPDVHTKLLGSNNPFMPPLYYFLLYCWMKMFGISETAVRLPSLIFGLACIPAIYMLGRKLFNARIGIYAAALMAASPLHIWYAQEARPYTIMVFWGILSSYLLYQIISYKKTRFWIIYFLISLAGIYTNYFYILLFILQMLYAAIFFRTAVFKAKNIIWFSLFFLAFLPWLPKFLSRLNCVRAGYWIPSPTLKSPFITLANFNLGYNVDKPIYIFSVFLALIILLNAFIALKKRKEWENNFLFCFVQFFGPVFLLYVFSKLVAPVYVTRGLILSSPYYYLILGIGLDSLADKWLKAILVSVFCSLLVFGDYAYFANEMPAPGQYHLGVYLKKPFKPLTKFIAGRFEQGDIVASTNLNPPVIPSLSFYNKKYVNSNIKYYTFLDTRLANEVISNNLIKGDPCRNCVFLGEKDQIEFKRIWLIASDGGSRTGGLDKNSREVNSRLGSKLKLEYMNNFDGLIVFLYSK